MLLDKKSVTDYVSSLSIDKTKKCSVFRHLMSKINIVPYTLIYSVTISNSKIVYNFKYRAKRFSIKDLRLYKIPDGYSGGKGRECIVNDYHVHYRYKNNINIYTLTYKKDDIDTQTNHRSKVRTITFSSLITDVINDLDKLIKNIWKIEQHYGITVLYEKHGEIKDELLSNILWHTNILHKEVTTKWLSKNTRSFTGE